ncbi:ABC transporter permease [Flexivirga sp. ID2601S]|uniref:ABC transporter permease n=1 Tax=Flexivirga aerilata TaxID=1656889 RepID=A0A849AFY3_9MICO|nr:ABC transporter permease [Flexivirga aerilata]NNG38773.1 ABC transporter permease [Flexivirga aerilata]
MTTGFVPYLRLELRRDRIWWPLWAVIMIAMPAATVGTYETVYPTTAEQAAATGTVNANPSLRALYGPAFDLSNAGGFQAWRVLGFTCLLAGFVGGFTMLRHTRAEEEAGRAELLRAGMLGRHTALTTTAFSCLGWALAVALFTAGLLAAQGLSLSGSLITGLGAAGCLLFFAGVGAVAAQIFERVGPARGVVGATLGAAYLLRAIGDSNDRVGFLPWLSPIGWAQQARPYADERPLVLLLFVPTTAILFTVALLLESHRDLGAGVVQPRLGPATGDLSGLTGLIARLQRGSLISWLIGALVAGLALGAITSGLLALLKDSGSAVDILRRMGGGSSLIDVYFAAIIPIAAVVLSAHGVLALDVLSREEASGRAEQVLAAAVPRTRLLLGHLAWALLGAVALMVVFGAGLAGAYLLAGGDSSDVGSILATSLGALPAVWTMTGIAALGVGLGGRWGRLGLVVLGLLIALQWFGAVVSLPEAVLDISPFRHLPPVGGASAGDLVPLGLLVVIAALLTAAAVVLFSRRDVVPEG